MAWNIKLGQEDSHMTKEGQSESSVRNEMDSVGSLGEMKWVL